jgi:hypothetical protein
VTREERLAALLHERFHCSPWWTTPAGADCTNDDRLTQLRRLRELKEADDGDTLTSVLPDQDCEVA